MASAATAARDLVDVVYDQLDHERAVAFVTHETAGAISTFIGTTRDNFNGKKVVRLEYEGYIPMAKLELQKICVQIREQWPTVVGIALLHRLGVVEVKEASVIIAVSSPHRRDALEACAFAIDTLKATVPIWKSEQYEGDSRVWKENVEWESGAAIRHSCCGSKRVMAPAKDNVAVRSRTSMGHNIDVRRLALRYSPPAIVVEYALKDSYHTQLYHHVIDLRNEVVGNSARTDSAVNDLVKRAMSQHESVLVDVSVQQLKRLIHKLATRHASLATPENATSDARAAAPVAAVPILPQADYNRVSETQLNQVKQKMDTVFQKNIIRPGDPGYKYDKQVAFQPSEEASDWDD